MTGTALGHRAAGTAIMIPALFLIAAPTTATRARAQALPPTARSETTWQLPTPGPARTGPRAADAFALFRPPPSAPAHQSSGAPDYRWEGLGVGAILLGALGVYVSIHYCSLGDSKDCSGTAVRLGPVGAFVGGIIGGLIGGLIPKREHHPKAPPADDSP